MSWGDFLFDFRQVRASVFPLWHSLSVLSLINLCLSMGNDNNLLHFLKPCRPSYSV